MVVHEELLQFSTEFLPQIINRLYVCPSCSVRAYPFRTRPADDRFVAGRFLNLVEGSEGAPSRLSVDVAPTISQNGVSKDEFLKLSLVQIARSTVETDPLEQTTVRPNLTLTTRRFQPERFIRNVKNQLIPLLVLLQRCSGRRTRLEGANGEIARPQILSLRGGLSVKLWA